MCIYINVYIYCKRLVLLITCNFVNGNVAWLLSCSADFAAEILIHCEYRVSVACVYDLISEFLEVVCEMLCPG